MKIFSYICLFSFLSKISENFVYGKHESHGPKYDTYGDSSIHNIKPLVKFESDIFKNCKQSCENYNICKLAIYEKSSKYCLLIEEGPPMSPLLRSDDDDETVIPLQCKQYLKYVYDDPVEEVPNVMLQQCVETCQTRSTCAVITYDRRSGICKLNPDPYQVSSKWNYIKYDMEMIKMNCIENPPVPTAPPPTELPASTHPVPTINPICRKHYKKVLCIRDYGFHDIDNIDECIDKCKSVPECKVIYFKREIGKCQLYGSEYSLFSDNIVELSESVEMTCIDNNPPTAPPPQDSSNFPAVPKDCIHYNYAVVTQFDSSIYGISFEECIDRCRHTSKGCDAITFRHIGSICELNTYPYHKFYDSQEQKNDVVEMHCLEYIETTTTTQKTEQPTETSAETPDKPPSTSHCHNREVIAEGPQITSLKSASMSECFNKCSDNPICVAANYYNINKSCDMISHFVMAFPDLYSREVVAFIKDCRNPDFPQ